AANFNMAVNIDNNQLQMTGAGPAEKIVINYAENGSGYLRGRRAGVAHWWLGCGSSGSSEAAFYNNLTGASVSLTTKIALNKPTDVQSVLTILDNGSLIFTKSGANPRNTRIFHAGDATRGNRLEIADDSSYLMYIERHPTIGVQLVTNGGHIKTNAGNVYTNTIQLNSGAQFVADGNIYLPNTTHGFSAGWLLQQINSRLNAAVQKSGDTMSGTLTMNANINMQEVENRGISFGNGSGTGIFQGRDGANNDYANIEIRSWYGVGFKNTQNSGAQFYNKNTIFMNLRNGQIQAYDYVTRSDRAYKENIKPIESASEKISKISGYTYNIKGSSEEIRSVGVIAQEVREVLPDAVSENEDGLLSVNYNAIIATLVQSNKEMQERIKALEKSRF
ncbi:tail fiber domain-containing protein, partial [Enterobacter cloacae]